MNALIPVLIVSLSAVAALAVVAGIYYLARRLSYRNGTLGKKRVDAALKKYGVIRNYKVLRDIRLSHGGREARIDHLMVGFFGLLFVSTVNDTAEYYGGIKDPSWTKVSGGNRQKIDNLIEKNLQNIDVVREICAEKGVFNLKMEGVVVFCGNQKKTIIGITGSPALMTFKKFKAYIHKAKFEKDNDVDVPALTALIQAHRA